MLTFREEIRQWEQQPKEGSQAFLCFAHYRDQGNERTLTRTARELHKSRSQITNWANLWQWVDRAHAYDRWLDRKSYEERAAEIVEFRKRAARAAKAKGQTLILPDIALAQKLSDPNVMQALVEMDVKDLIALSARCALALPQVIKAEALALGDVTERPAEPVAPADDPLNKWIHATEKARILAAQLIQETTWGRVIDDGGGSGEDSSGGLGDLREQGRLGPAPLAESAAPDVR